jgi:type I restriction enzyme S subunit
MKHDTWVIKGLGEICEVLDSQRIPITKRDRKAGMYPYYGATGILDYVDDYIFSEKLVLLGEDGAKWESGSNSAFIAQGKYWVNNHAHVLRPNRALVKDEWLVYYLNHCDLTKFISGLTVSKLNQERMRNIPIPLPPLPEQQRIVAILDQAFDAIERAKANTEKNLANARELFKSILSITFSKQTSEWRKTTLGEISDINYGYTEKTSFDEIGPKFLRITDIQNNNVDWEKVPYCRIPGKDMDKFKLMDGDIVIARTGATTGKSFLIYRPPISIFASYLIRVAIKNKDILIPEFLIYFFNSTTYWDSIKKGISGSTQGGFNATKLSLLTIPLPPLPEQQIIVAQLDTLSTETQKLEALYRQKLADLAELKRSILQKAFNGEL